MLFLYACGLLANKIKHPLICTIILTTCVFLTNMALGTDARGGPGFTAALYFVFGYGWFWLLNKFDETIMLWLLIFAPGGIIIWMIAGVIETMVYGQPVAQV